MTTYRTARSRGTAMVLAVVVLGLVAAAVTAVGSGVAMDIQRLGFERDEAQRQQYELAAIAIAQSQLNENRPADESLQLAGSGVSLSLAWTPANAGSRVVQLTVLGHTRIVTFKQTGNGWSLQSTRDA